MADLKNIFEKRIRKEHLVRSINGLFFTVDDSLEKTNYAPAYQRNYVWDDEKATYFIESIFLGTEVPPIILFKSEDEDGFNNYEVIDGRQRYETIKRFVNNELKLKKNGLQMLGDLEDFVGNTFSGLSEKYQNIFKDTCIRTIVYSFITDYSTEEEDVVKREIFQRYNTGITPLRTFEIDKAQNYFNSLNQALKTMFEEKIFDEKITKVFRWEKYNIDQKVIKLRELLVIHRIPIKYYATKKQKVIDKYFEYISSQLEAEEYEYILCDVRSKVDVLSIIEAAITKLNFTYNRLYAECIFWALSVLSQNGVEYDFSNKSIVDRLVSYLHEHEIDFTTVRSSFYKVIVGRYKAIAGFFESEYKYSFTLSIDNNEDFRTNNKLIVSSKGNKTVEAKGFEELRIKKPEPVSVRIPELIDSLKSHRFLIRPFYQRADVKNKKKSSSIIESLLLGITLPPIFVFKRKNGTSEVVDGQQRLLSIISYLGESYFDERNDVQHPFLHNFRLDLSENAILKDLKGSAYSDLSKADQNKIRNASIYLIEIKEDNNKDFDPVDLFVRLNNKPYPIPTDSFEMWNSFAPRDFINLVKASVANKNKWFYLRKNNSQMENENLYTTLAYFQYQFMIHGIATGEIAPEKTIESFVVDKRLSCRFRAKNEITKLLYNTQETRLYNSFNCLQYSFISNVYDLLGGINKNAIELNKSLDELLQVESGKRTQMVFYLLWILFHDLPCDIVRENRKEIRKDFDEIFKFTINCNNIDDFKNSVLAFRAKYYRTHKSMHFSLQDLVDITEEAPNNHDSLVLQKRTTSVDRLFSVNYTISGELTGNQHLYLSVNKPDINLKYIAAFLSSQLFDDFCRLHGDKMSLDLIKHCQVPYVTMEDQRCILNVLEYIEKSDGSVRKYFERILDLAFLELNSPNIFDDRQIHIWTEIKKFTDIVFQQNVLDVLSIIDNTYRECTKPSSVISMYLLRAVDMVL